MTIHHATAKRATDLGVTLTDGEEVRAFHKGTERVIEHESAKVALNLVLLAARFGAEYPSIGVTGDGEITLNEEVLFDFDVEDFDAEEVFAMALEAAQDAGYEGEEVEDDEEVRGNVVPDKYKKEYAARGNVNHCGDWLAGWLDGKFIHTPTDETLKPEFDWRGFEAFLIENGVDTSGKWAKLPESGQRGWQGRYRMNGRQKLEVVVAETGQMVHNGKKVRIDREWLAAMKAKHNVE